jgi:hypothetical protein
MLAANDDVGEHQARNEPLPVEKGASGTVRGTTMTTMTGMGTGTGTAPDTSAMSNCS